jgi:hypothetical protein
MADIKLQREGGREGGRFYANLAIFKLYHIEDNLISNEITLSHNVVHLAQIEIRTHSIYYFNRLKELN